MVPTKIWCSGKSSSRQQDGLGMTHTTHETYEPERHPMASAGLTPPPFVAVLNTRNALYPMVK
jgi:hypothetical protein